MINIEEYIEIIVEKLKETYFDRLVYIGLQGSYLRGEATENSDIDIMVVIDNMTIADLDNYRLIINSLEYSDKMCGFICSKTDIENWNPLEICHLVFRKSWICQCMTTCKCNIYPCCIFVSNIILVRTLY